MALFSLELLLIPAFIWVFFYFELHRVIIDGTSLEIPLNVFDLIFFVQIPHDTEENKAREKTNNTSNGQFIILDFLLMRLHDTGVLHKDGILAFLATLVYCFGVLEKWMALKQNLANLFPWWFTELLEQVLVVRLARKVVFICDALVWGCPFGDIVDSEVEDLADDSVWAPHGQMNHVERGLNALSGGMA